MCNKKYILFGAGRAGKSALNFLGKEKVAYFCDNRKAGQVIEEREIISFEQLRKIHQDYVVVITATVGKHIVEVVLQLERNGIPFVLLEDEAHKIIKKDLMVYNSLNKRINFGFDKEYEYPIFKDKYQEAGYLNSYFWQDLWAAQKIFQNNPKEHCDIGSRIDGFIAHLLSFRKNIKLFDIRPLTHEIPGVEFVKCDATNLEEIKDESIMSLSALCSLEHFGLGRYGDPIDPEACFKCFTAIQKKMQKGGRLYISVPVGKEHLEYNAHRVFFAETIVKAFDEMNLLEYSSAFREKIDTHIDIHKYDHFTEKGGELFGLFMFEKK